MRQSGSMRSTSPSSGCWTISAPNTRSTRSEPAPTTARAGQWADELASDWAAALGQVWVPLYVIESGIEPGAEAAMRAKIDAMNFSDAVGGHPP